MPGRVGDCDREVRITKCIEPLAEQLGLHSAATAEGVATHTTVIMQPFQKALA